MAKWKTDFLTPREYKCHTILMIADIAEREFRTILKNKVARQDNARLVKYYHQRLVSLISYEEWPDGD